MKKKKEQEGRVRKNTTSEQNSAIDELTIKNIKKHSGSKETIARRIRELEKEWSIERWLELNMSIISGIGLILAITIDYNWLVLPAVVLLFFIQHALQGWCPPLPVFRAFKVRTRSEIDKEKYALKAIRGDFKEIGHSAKEVFDIVNN